MPQFKRSPLGVSAIWLAFAASATIAVAQVELQEPEPPPKTFAAADDFLTLTGAGCAVRFSPGALDRADHLLRRLQLVTRQLNRWSDVPVPTAVFAVTRDEWEDAGLPGTYGIPIRVGPTTLVTAAAGDPGTVELWSRLLGARPLPMVFGTPLRGTAEEAATLALADVLLQVETARGMTQRSGLLGDEAWIGELSAHVAALVMFRLFEPNRLPEIADTFDLLDVRLQDLRRARPAAFHPALNLGSPEQLESWLWFQAKFHQGARILLDKDGKGAVSKLKKMSKKAGGALRRADLERRYPELGEWLSRGFGLARAGSPPDSPIDAVGRAIGRRAVVP